MENNTTPTNFTFGLPAGAGIHASGPPRVFADRTQNVFNEPSGVFHSTGSTNEQWVFPADEECDQTGYMCSLVARGPCKRSEPDEVTCHCARCEPENAWTQRLEMGMCGNAECNNGLAKNDKTSKFCAECKTKPTCPVCMQLRSRSCRTCIGSRLCRDQETETYSKNGN